MIQVMNVLRLIQQHVTEFKNVYQKDAIQFHQTPKLYSLTIWKVKALIWSRTPQAEDDDKKYAFYML